MKWEILFDEESKLIRVKIMQALTRNEVETLMQNIEKMIREKRIHKDILDFSESETISNLSKEVRDVYKKHAMTFPLDKGAIIVTSPTIRIIARIVLSSLGKSTSAKFFASEKDVLTWLKEEK